MKSLSMRSVPLDEGRRDILRRHLAEPGSSWSVGTWGAIGEFQYDAGEPGLEIDLAALSVQTDRGALRIVSLDDVHPFGLVDDSGQTREIAFCTPRPGAQRTLIEAVDELTFDLGVGAPHIDMLVRFRPADVEAACVLRAAAGKALFAPDHPAGAAVTRSNPAR